MALAIVLSLFIGNKVSFNRMRAELDDVFVNGVDGDGFSIQGDLDVIKDNGNSIIAIAKRYIGDDSSIKDASDSLQKLAEADSIKDKSRALDDFAQTIEIFYRSFKDNGKLSESDLRLLKMCYSEIESRLMTIRSNGYNDKVAEYNNARKSFPAGIISPLMGVKAQENF